jgi:ankyrin repeat protein
MNNYLHQQLINDTKNNAMDSVKSTIKKYDCVNIQDKENKTLMHYAIEAGRREMMNLLLENNADLDMPDKDGKTPLHLACDLGAKDIILWLLMNKANFMSKDINDKPPGAENREMFIFINDVVDEEACFKILNPEQINKLTAIFNDIDYDRTKKIDMNKALAFNHFIDPKVSSPALTRDAEDFIEEVAIINKKDVCLDEWLFSFSKLLFCDPRIFKKFIEDYKNAKIANFGSFSEIMTSKEEPEL